MDFLGIRLREPTWDVTGPSFWRTLKRKGVG